MWLQREHHITGGQGYAVKKIGRWVTGTEMGVTLVFSETSVAAKGASLRVCWKVGDWWA